MDLLDTLTELGFVVLHMDENGLHEVKKEKKDEEED